MKGVLLFAISTVSISGLQDDCVNKLDLTDDLSCEALFEATGLTCADASVNGSLAGMCDLTCGYCTPCEDGSMVEVRWENGGGQWQFQLVTLDNSIRVEDTTILDVRMHTANGVQKQCVAPDTCYEVRVFGGYQESRPKWSTNLNLSFQSVSPFYDRICSHDDGKSWYQPALDVEVSNTTSSICSGEIPAVTAFIFGKPTLSLTACGAKSGYATLDGYAHFDFINDKDSNIQVHLNAQAVSSTEEKNNHTRSLFTTQWDITNGVETAQQMLGLYASTIQDKENMISLAPAGETKQWLAAFVAMSDEFGDSWDGYDLRITKETDSNSLLFVGTVDEDFAWGTVALETNACYVVDVTAGIWAADVSWSVCNGAATGGAPARQVRFCVSDDGSCITPPPVPEVVDGKHDFLNYTFSTTPISSSNCGGPWPSRLTLYMEGCSFTLDAAIRDDRYETSSLVKSKLDHVSFDNERKTVLFQISLMWKRAGFFYNYDDDDDITDACTPDLHHTIELLVDTSLASSGLVRIRLANGDVYAVSGRDDDRVVGVTLTWNDSEEVLILDGHADNSLTHVALMCPKCTTEDGTITFQADSKVTNVVSVDCAGPNQFTFASPSATVFLCGDQVELGCLENECSVVYDPTFMSNGTLSASAFMGTVYINGVGVTSLTYNSTQHSIVVDCSQDIIRIAIEGVGILSNALRFRGCGASAISLSAWHCVPLDEINWLTASIISQWPEASEINGFVTCPSDTTTNLKDIDPTSTIRLLMNLDVLSPICLDELNACDIAVDWVVETQINDVDPHSTLCGTDNTDYRCRKSCGNCGSLIHSLPKPEACLDLDLRLYDQGWGGDLDYELREIVASSHVLKNTTYFNASVDTIRFVGSLENNAIQRLCLPINSCYSFRAGAGDRVDGIRWSFCNEAGSDDDESMDICIYESGCERWLNRFLGEGITNKTISRLTTLVDTSTQILLKSTAAQACHSYFKYQDTTLEGYSQFYVSVPHVFFKIDGYVVAEITAVFQNRAMTQGVAEPVDAGIATVYGSVLRNATSHSGLSVDWLVGLDCTSKSNLTKTVSVTLHAYWTTDLKQQSDNDAILSINLYSLSTDTSTSTIPNSLSFGVQATGYATVTEQFFSERLPLNYRFIRVPGLQVESLLTNDDHEASIRIISNIGLVLADGIYTITSIPTSSISKFCDGVIPLTIGANFQLNLGECSVYVKENDDESWLTFYENVRIEYRGASADNTVATCRGIDDSFSRLDIRVAGGTEQCAASLSLAYAKGTPRLVDVVSGKQSITWSVENVDNGLCETEGIINLDLYADYAYPWLSLSVTSSTNAPKILGYEYTSPKSLNSFHYFTTTEEDDKIISSTWREQFLIDCTDANAIASTSIVEFRGVDQVDLFVNGVFILTSFGATTLFEQRALPIRCDGLDVLAVKLVSHSSLAQFLARFELICDAGLPMIIDTDSTWSCRNYLGEEDDSDLWSGRNFSADSWPVAVELGDQPELDQFPLPSGGKWITASGETSTVLCRRNVRIVSTPTQKPTSSPTPKPIYMFTAAPSPPVIKPVHTPTKKKSSGSTSGIYKMVAIIVGFAILLFIANVMYQPCSRCISKYCGSHARREAELNEVMLSAFTPLHPDVELRATSPPNSPIHQQEQQRGSAFLSGRSGPSLAERISALHRHDNNSHTTEHQCFTRLEDHDDIRT